MGLHCGLGNYYQMKNYSQPGNLLSRWFGSAVATPGASVTPASQFSEAGVLYLGLTMARIFVYLLHVTGEPSLLVNTWGDRRCCQAKRDYCLSAPRHACGGVVILPSPIADSNMGHLRDLLCDASASAIAEGTQGLFQCLIPL